MGRPTIAEQIAKAAEEGNLEKVKELSSKLIVKPKSKPKPKTKNKDISKPKKPAAGVEVYEDEIIESEEVNPKLNKKNKQDFIVSARDPNKQQKYTNDDGEEKIRARIVPFKVVKNRKNIWKDDKKSEIADIEFDKKVRKNTKGKTVKSRRDPINKIKVKCFKCKEIKLIWPGEVTHSRWSCDECLTPSGGKSERDF
jgi:hypothetical protein